MPRYRVTISGKTYDAMADLVRKHKLHIAGHTGKKAGRGQYVVDAFADSDQIELLRSEGHGIDVREDVKEAGRQRQAEVRALAFAAEGPRVASADHYLTVDDIDASLAAAAASPNAGFTRLIKLPNKTWEGRDCHAIRIANGNQPGRPCIFFLGGVHSREWGNPDILGNFVEQLCDAFRTQRGIT